MAACRMLGLVRFRCPRAQRLDISGGSALRRSGRKDRIGRPGPRASAAFEAALRLQGVVASYLFRLREVAPFRLAAPPEARRPDYR
jgi:hypothetical protein